MIKGKLFTVTKPVALKAFRVIGYYYLCLKRRVLQRATLKQRFDFRGRARFTLRSNHKNHPLDSGCSLYICFIEFHKRHIFQLNLSRLGSTICKWNNDTVLS